MQSRTVIRPAIPSPAPVRHGRYLPKQLLGTGGMGEVWKAWDPQLGRWVALKLLRANEADEIARFRREALTAARLSHPHIAAVYEHGETAGRPWIAMQFVPGLTLKDHPRRDRRQLVDYVRDAARALHAAHAAGIVHRDVKPENLMVADGHLFVMDFGLARAAGAGSDLSAPGLVVGTPSYMAPEQARAGRVDARSDVWGLGATLYELLTGRKPFERATLVALLRSIQEDDPARPRAIDPSIPADLETVILKCLSKDPRRRYASAAELADDLDRWLSGRAILAKPVTASGRAWRWVRRRPALAAALFVALAGIGAALVLQRRAAEAEELARLWTSLHERKRDLRGLRVPAPRARLALEQSLAEVRGHLDRHPGSSRAWQLRAWGELVLGRLAEAGSSAARAAELEPGAGPAHALAALISLERASVFGTGSRRLDLRHRDRELKRRIEEASDWFRRAGPGAGAEDEVASTLVAVLRRFHEDGDAAAAAKRLEEAAAQRRAEEYAVWIALLAPGRGRSWIERSVAWAPGYARGWYALGCMKSAIGDFAGAESDHERVLQLDPGHAGARVNRGLLRSMRGDDAGARADFDAVIAANPGSLEGRVNRAGLSLEHRDFAAARRDIEEVLRLAPGEPSGWSLRSELKMEEGDRVEAEQDIDRALALDAGYGPAWMLKARIRRLRGDLAGSASAMDRAVDLMAGSGEVHAERALLRLQLGDLVGALKDLDEALRVEPAHGEWSARRALVRMEEGNLAGAGSDLEAARRSGYDGVLWWIGRAGLALEEGDAAGAIELLRKAPPGLDRHALAWKTRARAFRATGDLPGAMAAWDRAVELEPGDLDSWFQRGILAGQGKDYAAAIRDFTQALALKPGAPEILYNRGGARWMSGDRGGARVDFEEALRRAPADWPLRAAVEAKLKP